MAAAFKIIQWTICLAVSTTFVLAGAIKICDPAQFYADIMGYQIVRGPLAATVAYFLPPLEIFSGVALLFPRWRMAAGGVIAGLTLLFIVLIASAWWRGLDINCGCFGGAEGAPSYFWPIVRDLLIIFGLLVIYALNIGKFSAKSKKP